MEQYYLSFLDSLKNPSLQYIILVSGFSLLLIELATPGFALFGIIGSFLLLEFFFMEFEMFSYSYFLALIGLLFILLEVITGFTGLLFTLGLISIMSGLILATYFSLVTTNWLLFVVLLFFLVLICLGFYLGIRKIISLKRKKTNFFVLKNETGHILSEQQGSILAQCRIDGAIWAVRAQHNEHLAVGDRVRVLNIDQEHSILEVVKETA